MLEKIAWLREQLYLDMMLWQVDYGGQDAASMERSVRLFAQEVMPKVD